MAAKLSQDSSLDGKKAGKCTVLGKIGAEQGRAGAPGRMAFPKILKTWRHAFSTRFSGKSKGIFSKNLFSDGAIVAEAKAAKFSQKSINSSECAEKSEVPTSLGIEVPVFAQKMAKKHGSTFGRQGTRNRCFGKNAPIEIAEKTSIPDGGNLSKYLEELTNSGFVATFFAFGKKKKEIRFRLTDEFSLFGSGKF